MEPINEEAEQYIHEAEQIAATEKKDQLPKELCETFILGQGGFYVLKMASASMGQNSKGSYGTQEH